MLRLLDTIATVPIKNNPIGRQSQQVTAKIIRESQQQAKRDLTEKWRFLRKVGAYQTKETAAQNRLTKSRIREINKRFTEIQQTMRELRKGRSIYPIELISYKTPSGKTRVKYDLRPKFQFVKTKYKPKISTGVKKTKTGYILQKTSSGAKMSINKRGDVIERIGRTKRVKTKYSGDDMVRLIEALDSGKYKWKKGEVISFNRFGSIPEFISGREQAVARIAKYIQEVITKWDSKDAERFLNLSHIEFITQEAEDLIPIE